MKKEVFNQTIFAEGFSLYLLIFYLKKLLEAINKKNQALIRNKEVNDNQNWCR